MNEQRPKEFTPQEFFYCNWRDSIDSSRGTANIQQAFFAGWNAANNHVTSLQQEKVKQSEPKEFKVGDVVQLKSGGPLMTVYKVIDEEESIGCIWAPVDGTEPIQDCFEPYVLKHIQS